MTCQTVASGASMAMAASANVVGMRRYLQYLRRMTKPPRVTGIGGIFFKTPDPERTKAWYREHLGFEPTSDGTVGLFEWRDAARPERKGMTVWAPFAADTRYF